MKTYKNFTEEYQKMMDEHNKKVGKLRQELIDAITEKYRSLNISVELKFFDKDSKDCYYDDEVQKKLNSFWISIYDRIEDVDVCTLADSMWETPNGDIMISNESEYICDIKSVEDIRELENILKYLIVLTPEQIQKQEEMEEIHKESDKFNI